MGWDISGSAMVGILVTFLVGLLLVAQGILAVYLSHIYVQAQGRPPLRRGSFFITEPVRE